MPSRFITASHDEFDPGFQAMSHEEHINPYEGMDLIHLSADARHLGHHSTVSDGRSLAKDNPNTYEDLISYYFADPVATHKAMDQPVHRSQW